MSEQPEKPNDKGLPLEVKCPGCGIMAPYQGNPTRPFCSERCQVNDRVGWAEEKYSIPSEDTPQESWNDPSNPVDEG